MTDRSSYFSSVTVAETADSSAETATPADVRTAAGESRAAKRAAERVLGAWDRIQKKAARAGEVVRRRIVAATPYVLAKIRALVARVAELASQGTRWTLDQLVRLDDLTQGHLRDLAFYAVLALLTIACARDPLLLVRLGEQALSGLLEGVSGFLKMILSGLALMLAARVLCAVAHWAWDLSRSVVAAVLEGLDRSASRVAKALSPAVEPVTTA